MKFHFVVFRGGIPIEAAVCISREKGKREETQMHRQTDKACTSRDGAAAIDDAKQRQKAVRTDAFGRAYGVRAQREYTNAFSSTAPRGGRKGNRMTEGNPNCGESPHTHFDHERVGLGNVCLVPIRLAELYAHLIGQRVDTRAPLRLQHDRHRQRLPNTNLKIPNPARINRSAIDIYP